MIKIENLEVIRKKENKMAQPSEMNTCGICEGSAESHIGKCLGNYELGYCPCESHVYECIDCKKIFCQTCAINDFKDADLSGDFQCLECLEKMIEENQKAWEESERE